MECPNFPEETPKPNEQEGAGDPPTAGEEKPQVKRALKCRTNSIVNSCFENNSEEQDKKLIVYQTTPGIFKYPQVKFYIFSKKKII